MRILPVAACVLLLAGCDSADDSADVLPLRAEASVTRGASYPTVRLTLRNEGTVPLAGIGVDLMTRLRNGTSGIVNSGIATPLAPGASTEIDVIAPGLNDPDFDCYRYTVHYSYPAGGPDVSAGQAIGGTCAP